MVGTAYHLGAPAVGPTDNGWAVAWADGPHLYFRQVMADGVLTQPQALNLGSRAPWGPVLLPASRDGWHLLWWDLDAFGGPRLYSARLLADGTLWRGPITVTPEAASSAAIAPADDYAVAIVWADAGPRPTLYGQSLDAEGRPAAGPPTLIARNAGWPALARTGDRLWVLAWLALPDSPHISSSTRTATVRLSPAPLPWEAQAEPLSVGLVRSPDLTEYIETVQLGLDATHGYLFVGRRNAETGQPRTDTLAFLLGSVTSPPPSQEAASAVSLPATPPAAPNPFTTGFNTGPAVALPADAALAQAQAEWPTPAWGQSATLPVAFVLEGQIAVGYFQGGRLAAYQPITLGSDVIGPPGLWVDRDRHLSLAWANRPAEEGAGPVLVLSSTRPSLREAFDPQGG